MKIVITVALITMLYYIDSSTILRVIFSALFPILSFLVEYLPMFKHEKKSESDNENKSNKMLKVVSIILSIIIVVVSVVGNILVNDNTSVSTNNTDVTDELTTVSQLDVKNIKKRYSFNTITKDKDFDTMFTESESYESLYSDLLYSLQSIEYRTEPSEEQLVGNNPYGNNAMYAKHYEELLFDELDNNYANSREVNKAIYDKAISSAKEMDDEYDTSVNRHRIVKLLRASYLNALNDDNGEIQDECIRYAWGLLYTEISYDKYDKESIDLLIQIYEETNNSSRCNTIIKVLHELKDYFSTNPPHSIKNTK